MKYPVIPEKTFLSVKRASVRFKTRWCRTFRLCRQLTVYTTEVFRIESFNYFREFIVAIFIVASSTHCHPASFIAIWSHVGDAIYLNLMSSFQMLPLLHSSTESLVQVCFQHNLCQLRYFIGILKALCTLFCKPELVVWLNKEVVK